MTPAQPTVLAGALVRHADGSWRWRDGTPEPRVRDLSRDLWNFRCRTYGHGDTRQTFVEVLRGIAHEEPDLAWVLTGARAGRYRVGHSGDHTGPRTAGGTRMHVRPGCDPLLGHPADADPSAPGPIPRVLLVPITEWDAWVRAAPAGASWDRTDEPDILRLAALHGWRPAAHLADR